MSNDATFGSDDTLKGGTGADVFEVTEFPGSSSDTVEAGRVATITDFDPEVDVLAFWTDNYDAPALLRSLEIRDTDDASGSDVFFTLAEANSARSVSGLVHLERSYRADRLGHRRCDTVH